jgi:hypothetical protein
VIRTTDTRPAVDSITVDPEHGFNVPETDDGVNKWFRWCYSMIAEAAPELFDSKVATRAYNDLVAACAKYPELKLATNIGIQLKEKNNNRYSNSNIHYGNWWPEDKLVCDGFPVYISRTLTEPHIYICMTNMPYYYTKYLNDPVNSDFVGYYNSIRSDIQPKCVILYDVIISKLISYMAAKNKIHSLKCIIANADKFLQRAENKRMKELLRHKKLVKYYEDLLKNSQEEYLRITGTHMPAKSEMWLSAQPAAAVKK